MASDDWHPTDDVGEVLARAGEFLRSRPAPHTLHLTVTENLRVHGGHCYGDGAPSSVSWAETGHRECAPPSSGHRPSRSPSPC